MPLVTELDLLVQELSAAQQKWEDIGRELIRCGCEKRRNYHRTLTSKAVAGVFAVFATGKYTAASVSVEREHVEWR